MRPRIRHLALAMAISLSFVAGMSIRQAPACFATFEEIAAHVAEVSPGMKLPVKKEEK